MANDQVSVHKINETLVEEPTAVAINQPDNNYITFNHTNVKEQYSTVDAEESLEKPKAGYIDFGPAPFRSGVRSSSNNISDEYDRMGSFLPREEFNKFLELIENESLKMAGWGPRDNVFQNFVSKLDRFGTALVPMNMLNTGYTFITRPRLNLTIDNLRTNPIMSTLASGDPQSVTFMIRGLLDTVLSGGDNGGQSSPAGLGPLTSLQSGASKLFASQAKQYRATILAEAKKFHAKALTSSLLDVNNPFLTPLCNGLKGISGFPDLTVDTETTEGDFHSGDFTFVKGSDMNNRTNELSLEFRDVQGSIIISIIFYWVLAMALQAKGVMVAYPDDIYEQRLNYTVSIYRFVMDTSKKHILWWAKATGCYPKSVPVGSLFNISQGEGILTSAQNFSIPFVANDVKVNDPNILLDFNTLVSRYCPSLFPTNDSYQKMSDTNKPFDLNINHPMYNFIGLPVIVNGTSGLELAWRTNRQYLKEVEQDTITETNGNQTTSKSYMEKAYEIMVKAKNAQVDKIEKSIRGSSQNLKATPLENARKARISKAMNAKMDLNVDPKIKTGINIKRTGNHKTSTYTQKNITTGRKIARTNS